LEPMRQPSIEIHRVFGTNVTAKYWNPQSLWNQCDSQASWLPLL